MSGPVVSSPRRRNFDLGERLVDRLKDLVSKYPKGLGLVKEFLQNADDARATVLRVYYDPRSHPGCLDDPQMNVALGPALLLVNDRPFSDDDLKHVQTISNSGKLRDAGRTGRFGHGLNTWYSVSDHPSLLTGDALVWFDPHRWIQDQSANAYAWDLSEAARAWPAWIETFAPAGVNDDDSPFEGAAFRLPLRTPEAAGQSEITQEAFGHADWEELLTQVRAVGPALLVFLRSVVALELSEILPSGSVRLRARIRTTNASEVEAARAPLRELVRGAPIELVRAWATSDEEPPHAAFKHAFAIEGDDARPAFEDWEVVTELAWGSDRVLLKEATELCALGEKVIPWAGAACRRGAEKASSASGFACFLPLPEAGTAPVWLHGWFAIDSSRRGIVRVADGDDLSRHRVRWNRLLMEHGVGPAWAKLVSRLNGSAPTQARPYDLWPQAEGRDDEVSQALSRGFYGVTKGLAVFRARSGAGAGEIDWQPREKLWDVPVGWCEHLNHRARFSNNIVLTVDHAAC